MFFNGTGPANCMAESDATNNWILHAWRIKNLSLYHFFFLVKCSILSVWKIFPAGKAHCLDVLRSENTPFLTFWNVELLRRTRARPIKDNPAIIEEKLDDFEEGGRRRQYQSRPIWGHQHEIWFHKTNSVSFLMCLTFTVNEKVLIARWHFFIIWFQKV